MENKEDLIFKTYKPKLTNFAWWIEFAKICAFCVTIISSKKIFFKNEFDFLVFLCWHFKKESAPKGQLEKEDKTNYENDKRKVENTKFQSINSIFKDQAFSRHTKIDPFLMTPQVFYLKACLLINPNE